MADLSELIFSKDFERYRKQQVMEITKHVHSLLQDSSVDINELRGALELGRRIVRLPLTLVDQEKYAEKLNKMIQTDHVDISTSLVREFLKEIE